MLFKQTNEVYTCYSAKRTNAKQRGIKFDMSFETFAALKKQTHCQYSGLPLKGVHEFSFERIDNNIGYIDGNVIVVSRAINSARSNYTIPQLADLINTLSSNQTRTEHSIANPRELYPVDCKPRVNPNNPKYKDLMRAWDAQNRAIQRRNILIEDHLQLLKHDKPARIKGRMRSLEKHRQLLAEETAKLTITRTKLVALYRKFKRVPVRTDRPNIFAETWNAARDEQLTTMNETAKKNAQRIEYLKYALLGLMRFENLSHHDALCIKFGLPLNSSPEHVKVVEEYRKCMR